MSHGRAFSDWVGLLALAVVALGSACAHHPASPPPATVRFAAQEPCAVCDIEVSARQLAGEGALDCGHSHDRATQARVQECARKAEAEGHPFLAILDRQGIDSKIIEGFVRAPDGSLSRLSYDSDGTGSGMACNAMITRIPCGHLVPHPEDPSYLTCELKAPRTTVCRERVFTPGPPAEANTLECSWWEDYLSYGECIRVAPGKGNVPPGTVLVCRQRVATRPDVFECSRSADGDAALGIRWNREAPPNGGGSPSY